MVTFYLGWIVSKITRLYCKPACNITSLSWKQSIVISPPGAFTWFSMTWFWKSDNEFMIVICSNFLAAMHGFRDNKVLLQTGYDVIVCPSLGAFHTIFVDGIWKSDPSFIIMVHCHISHISYRFKLFSILFWLVIAHPDQFFGCFRVKHPQINHYTFFIPKGSSLNQTASFEDRKSVV